MKNRFRHMNHGQLVGLYLHMQALLNGKRAVSLTNKCLRRLLGVHAVYGKRFEIMAASFAPFLVGHQLHSFGGHPKTATFMLPGVTETKEIHTVMSIPTDEEMEQSLQIEIKQIETEKQSLTIVKGASFET